MKKDKVWLDKGQSQQSLKSNVKTETSKSNIDVTTKQPHEEVTLPQSYFRNYKVKITTLLRIRRGPGLDYEQVGLIPANETRCIIEEQDGWGKIDEEKWIKLEFTQRV